MRLFEAEVRADSMAASASGPNFNTQASNFSFFKRSGTLAVITTVSTPNWRKQSDRIILAGSLRLTKATRADAFLLGGIGVRVVPRDLFMSVAIALKTLFWAALSRLAKG